MVSVTGTTASSGAAPGGGQVELSIGGMTCASCAARIERRLNKLDGISATVNFATEKARVAYPDGMSPDELVAVVEKVGYTATVPPPPAPPAPAPGTAPETVGRTEATADAADANELRAVRQRLVTAVVLSVPVVVMAMVPALQFRNWQWLSLTLAAPVVAYAGWPFHKAAWANLRHGAATTDTLISMGTLAAFVWSLWALFAGDAGMPGMTHPFELTVARDSRADAIYLEVAAGVTAAILAGRFFEARSKRRAGAALRALLELGAKDVAVLRDGPGGTVEQ